jgi:CubicO group peptidase (beta-lactamase class C family)
MMAAGYREMDELPEGDLVGMLLNRPLASAPGKQFSYDSGSSHLLSAVLTETTGISTGAYAREHLFRPLNIEAGEWGKDFEGVTLGSTGLSLRARDLAKLGHLYLRGGKWDGEQLVPAAYVRESTKRHIGVGRADRGYGYQWWTHSAGRASGFAALGYGGRAVTVFPKLDLVVVLTSDAGSGREQSLGPILFDLIAPAVET